MSKAYDIIKKDFDARCTTMVISYILDKGAENVAKITHGQIAKLEGNPLMTQEFVQALVRTARKICKECSQEEIVCLIQDEWDCRQLRDNRVNTHNLAMQIIENFEDLLDEKGITIPCADKTEERERHDDGNEAKIYGTEYGELHDAVEETLIAALDKAFVPVTSYEYE